MTNHQEGLPARAGELLAALGRELREPLLALVAEVHRLDEQHERDDSVAELVELAHGLSDAVEPLTALAAFEARADARPCVVDVASLLGRVAEALRLRVVIRGKLGTSFEDEGRLEEGFSLFLRLVSGNSRVPNRVQVVREVHAASDRIVCSFPVPRSDSPLGAVRIELARRVASGLGGTFEIDGSRLRFEIPARVADEDGRAGPVLAFRREAKEESLAAEPGEGVPIVLVVDHEPAARDYMTRILDLEGYEVRAVGDLEKAREAVSRCRPDVIVLDPLELAEEGAGDLCPLKNDAGLTPIPIVLVRNPGAKKAFGPVDASDVVTKPIDPASLLGAVHRQTGAQSSPLLLIVAREDTERWKRLLEGETLRIVTANDTSEARRLIDTMTPEVVILDAGRVAGCIGLLEEIRHGSATRDVPVLAVSGRMPKKDRLHLESLADARMSRSTLGPTALRNTLHNLRGGAARGDYRRVRG